MTVESAVYLQSLDATYPASSDAKSEGDNHLRLLKAVLKASFTGITGACTATHTQLNYLASATGTTGTTSTNLVFSTSPTLVTPILGTPTSGTLTNCTGLPVSTGIAGLGTGVATFLATPSSANLASAVTGETGSGALVFGTGPTLADPITTGTLDGVNGDFSGTLVVGGSTTLAAVSATTGAFTDETSVTRAANAWALKVKASGGDELQFAGAITGNASAPSIRAVTSGGAGYSGLTLDASSITTKISGTTKLSLDASTFAITPAVTMASTLVVNNGGTNKWFSHDDGTAGYWTSATAGGGNGIAYGASNMVIRVAGGNYLTVTTSGVSITGALSATNTATVTQAGDANNKYISLVDTATGGKEWAFYNRLSVTAGVFGIRNVTDGVNALQFDASGNLTLAAYGAVTVGAADSGGTGYRVLRVPN